MSDRKSRAQEGSRGMSGKEKKVYRIFQRIAGRYDRANERISLGLQGRWKQMLTRALSRELPEKGQVLDVCCGTGDVSLLLAEARSDLSVTGIDFSPAMLKVAEQRKARAVLRGKRSRGTDRRKRGGGTEGRAQVRFLRGNAMALPFRDGAFDAAVISFGLRNTADYRKTLSEMKRVVKEGGTVACLDSFVPGSGLVQPFYRFYFRILMPLLGGGLKYREEYQWLYQSTKEFLRREELAGLFRDLGLGKVRAESRMFGACSLVSGVKTLTK